MGSNMRVLLVEDEVEMAKALGAVLSQHRYVVDHMPNLALAREAVRENVHDAVILDRQLPDGDGFELLRDMRSAGDRTPVVVLTAHNMPDDRIEGLDGGADDYLGKPFLVDELMARLRAVVRRADNYSSQSVREGNVTIFLDSHEAVIDDVPLPMPRREMLVLQLLVRRAGRTVLRRNLEEAVYGYDDEIQSNALDSHISRLRKRLADAGATVSIHSMRGLGYLLKAS